MSCIPSCERLIYRKFNKKHDEKFKIDTSALISTFWHLEKQDGSWDASKNWHWFVDWFQSDMDVPLKKAQAIQKNSNISHLWRFQPQYKVSCFHWWCISVHLSEWSSTFCLFVWPTNTKTSERKESIKWSLPQQLETLEKCSTQTLNNKEILQTTTYFQLHKSKAFKQLKDLRWIFVHRMG